MTDRLPPSSPAQAGPSDWLVGGGEMGRLIRAMDWSATPLGPLTDWPPSLRTAANLALDSNFPIALAWGARHTQLYNDGYWPLCGAKHPASLGQDFTECWATAWPAIGDAFDRALGGRSSFVEDRRMFLDRLGYLEETFFTFSFSPIRDETGAVVGLFHPVTETTAKILGQRRMRALHELAGLRARSMEESWALAARALAEAVLDLPFVLFYQIDGDGLGASLAAHAGLEPGGAAPPTLRLVRPSASRRSWPLAKAAASRKPVLVEDVARRFPGLVCGPYPEPIRSAMVLPVCPPGHDAPVCLVVAGASSRLPMNEAYWSFYDLLADALATVVGNAVAFDEEKRRAESLAELDRAKTAFFSSVSHEFRTPLALVLAPLEDELSEPGRMPAARRERLDIAHRNSLRLLRLVNALLDFTAIEAGRVHALYEPSDLAALTTDLTANFRSACERAGLALRVDCPPLPEPVFVDRSMWETIVLNLLSNAFKYTLAGSITVRLAALGERVELHVADTGCGIPAEELPRVFERFHRVKGVHGRSEGGSGIGLALVHELVGLHGGSIAVESVEGQGSVFVVTLPRGRAHLPANRIGTGRFGVGTSTGSGKALVEEALRWVPPATGAGKGRARPGASDSKRVCSGAGEARRPRILWADDNGDMRDYVSRLLAERYDIDAVAHGEAALAAARKAPPDLILADVMMPRLDGLALVRELRADRRTRGVPVILLSARAGEEARIEGRSVGADDYLTKPFTARELLARVAANLDLARLRREAEAAARREAEIAHEAAAQAAALRKSEQRYAAIIAAALDAFIGIDAAQRIVLFNPAAETMFRCSAADAIGSPFERFIPERFRAGHRFHVGRYLERGTTARAMGQTLTLWGLRSDGEEFPVEASICKPELEDGIAIVIVRDVTGRLRTETALRDGEERLRQAVRVAGLGFFDHDHLTGAVEISPELRRMWGEAPDRRASLEHFIASVHPADRARVAEAVARAHDPAGDGTYSEEYRFLRPDGSIGWMSARGQTFFAGEDGARHAARSIGAVLDITERKRAEEQLRRLSQHDVLTGLPNRALLYEFADRLLARARREGSQLAFMFVDLDRFKPINDTYGHETGDAVLKRVAERLSACVRGEDVVGRLGGDEFLVILAQTRSEADAARVARNALSSLGRLYRVGDLNLQVSPSIGISLYPQDGAAVETLIKNADTAMFHAKDRGRNNVQFFRCEFNARVDEALRIEGRLREGLAHHEFELFFQPVIDLDSGALVSAEALIRWPAMHTGPSRFIPVAETAGFMKALGGWVLHEACRQQREWREGGLPAFPLAVNISATQFREPRFVDRVAEAIERAGLAPTALRIELAEGTVMKNVDEASSVLRALRRLGVTVALDDFGTGHSSLSHLSRLPLDILKLDQSFIGRVGEDRGAVAVVDGIIALANALGLETIAEGVESEEAIAFLRSRRCRQGQGFHFSRPLPAKRFQEWCRRRAA